MDEKKRTDVLDGAGVLAKLAQLPRDCAEVIKLAPHAPWLGAETAEQRAERERVWNETQKDGADE